MFGDGECRHNTATMRAHMMLIAEGTPKGDQIQSQRQQAQSATHRLQEQRLRKDASHEACDIVATFSEHHVSLPSGEAEAAPTERSAAVLAKCARSRRTRPSALLACRTSARCEEQRHDNRHQGEGAVPARPVHSSGAEGRRREEGGPMRSQAAPAAVADETPGRIGTGRCRRQRRRGGRHLLPCSWSA